MADEYLQKIEQFLNRHDIKTYRFERRAKHRAVMVQHNNGKACCVIFPTTGSDWRGPANTVSELRHALGLFIAHANDNKQRKPPKPAKPRRAVHRGPRPVSCEEPISRVDKFHAPLMLLKARLLAAAAAAEPTKVNTAGAAGHPAGQPSPPAPQADRVRLMTPSESVSATRLSDVRQDNIGDCHMRAAITVKATANDPRQYLGNP